MTTALCRTCRLGSSCHPQNRQFLPTSLPPPSCPTAPAPSYGEFIFSFTLGTQRAAWLSADHANKKGSEEVSYTAYGRIETDITKVPTPAKVKEWASESFESKLQAQSKQAASKRSEPAPQRLDSRNPEVEAQPQAEVSNKATHGSTDQTPQQEVNAAQDQGQAQVSDTAQPEHDFGQQPAQTAQTHSHGEGSGLRIEAGKGSEPTSVSSPDSSLFAAGKNNSQTSQVRMVQTGAVIPATVASTSGVTSTNVSTQASQQISSTARTTGPATTGFKTFSQQALQLAEAAKDSVFKQVAMRITPEGGEMVMHLDPPELGQLDLRMVVEKGVVTKLYIGAERPEVAMMLEKHMHELKQVLSDQGLTVQDAEVQTKDFNQKQSNDRQHGAGGQEQANELETNEPWGAQHLQQAGFVIGEGLDFWV